MTPFVSSSVVGKAMSITSLLVQGERGRIVAADKLFAEEIVDMKNLIEDARGELSLIRAVVNSWETQLTEGMDKIWKCDDYDKFRADFVKFVEEYRKADAALLALLQAGSEARREYEKMEAEIVDLNITRA